MFSSRSLRLKKINLDLVSMLEIEGNYSRSCLELRDIDKKSRSRLELRDLEDKILVLVSNLEIERDKILKSASTCLMV